MELALGSFRKKRKKSLATIAVRTECDRQDDWAPLVDRLKKSANLIKY